MDYCWDIFISYAGDELRNRWIHQHFKPLLASYLKLELGRAADIYTDKSIMTGQRFPRELAEGLARSRVLVPVFSRDYFCSEWCLHELDLMHARQCSAANADLIVPIRVHDGEMLPNELGPIQRRDFESFYNPYLAPDSRTSEAFADAVRAFVPHVANALAGAPSPETNWRSIAEERFNSVYLAEKKGGQVPLETLTRKPPTFPTNVPRPRP